MLLKQQNTSQVILLVAEEEAVAFEHWQQLNQQ